MGYRNQYIGNEVDWNDKIAALEYIRTKFNERDYELLSTEYKNSTQKLQYRCRKHPDTIQEITYTGFRSGRGCRLCAKNYPVKTIEDANRVLQQYGRQAECIEYAGNCHKSSSFRCKLDGTIWHAPLSNIKLGKTGCPMCSKVLRVATLDAANRRLADAGKEIVCTDYCGNLRGKSHFKCLVDGYEWDAQLVNLLQKNRGCPSCHKLARISTINEVNMRLKEMNASIECVDYIGTVAKKSCFKCLICGHKWKSSFNNIQSGNGCPVCSSSRGEKRVRQYLDSRHISYIAQYRDSRCKDLLCLPMDFYLPAQNTVIEYQGEQHYSPIDFAGRGEEWAMEHFCLVQRHDTIRRNFCMDNHYNLIEIPYWEYQNLESFLDARLAVDFKKGGGCGGSEKPFNSVL